MLQMTHHLTDTNVTLVVGKQICALKRERGGAARRVAFNDVIDCGTTAAHPTIYDTLPKRVVAT